MEKPLVPVVFFLASVIFLQSQGGPISTARAARTQDGSESWGYVEVRPKAHMFWWYYRSPYRTEDPRQPWPIVLWLQGGPGGSGTGVGNFEEIGPLDTFLQPRNSTWLKKADLLFVDNPVGSGYSYVEDTTNLNLFVKSDHEAAADLTTLLIHVFNPNKTLQDSPLYVVAQSYGGKFAVTLGLAALKAIHSRKLNLKLGGIALGDSWISPEDFVFSWGPLLKDLSRLDDNGLRRSNRLAEKIRQEIASGAYANATDTWSDLERVISQESNYIDFYNFLKDKASPSASTSSSTSEPRQQRPMAVTPVTQYSTYLSLQRSPMAGLSSDLSTLMNGEIKKKLKIIPQNVTWGGQGDLVFDAFAGDFMKPRIQEVDELLGKGVNVTVYSGQVDVICSSKGTEVWVHKLKWDGMKSFLRKSRTPLYCGNEQGTKAFLKSYKNFHFYWILGGGHFVPADQPCIALEMVGRITQSPTASTHTSR